MNIYFESPQRLKIELSAADLDELGITYDELDYRSEHTRNIVNDLLQRIGAEGQFGAQSKRIIEIFPRGEDGCIMYFTAVSAAVIAKKRQMGYCVFETEDTEALYRLAESIEKASKAIKISLYHYNDRYRLIINEHIDKAMLPLFGEFARKCGERHAALFTAEHGKLLSSDLLGDLLKATGVEPRRLKLGDGS